MREHTFTAHAMGTEVLVSIVSDNETDATLGGTSALDTIAEYEQQFSRFLPESELSRINESKNMVVTGTFLEVLEIALVVSRKTKEVFNPLFQISRLGYEKSFDTLSSIQKRNLNEPYNIDIEGIKIDGNTNVVTLAEGQKLDFGGFLKGYLATHIADMLMKTYQSYRGVIVNLGGDLATRGVDEDEKPFVFGIYNPITKADEMIEIKNKSLATSGTYKRLWKTNEGTSHHILDKTGSKNPTTEVISASVIHENGELSEAYAKLLLTLPRTEAEQLINEPTPSYLLIEKDGHLTRKNI